MHDEPALTLATVEPPVGHCQEPEVRQRHGAARIPEARVECPLERSRERLDRRVVRVERNERERQGEKTQHRQPGSQPSR